MGYGGYDFTSPLADGADALEAFLTKRETKKRQDMIDALNTRVSESKMKEQDLRNRAYADAQEAATAERQQKTNETKLGGLDPGDEFQTPDQQTAAAALGRVKNTPAQTAPDESFEGPLAPSTQTYTGTQAQRDTLKKQSQTKELGSNLWGHGTPESDMFAQLVEGGSSIADAAKAVTAMKEKPAKSANDFENYLTGKYGDNPTPAQRLAARTEWAGAERKPTEAPEPVGVQDDAITSHNGTKYIDMSAYSGKEKSQARKEAHKAGIVPLGKEDASALKEVQNAHDNLDYVQQQITAKLPTDAAGRLTGGLENKLSQWFQTDDQLSASGSLRAAAINSLRAAAGSKGFRMTEAEIQLAVNNDIPKITDTVGTAMQKLNNMRELINNAEYSHLGQQRPKSPGVKPSKYHVTVE